MRGRWRCRRCLRTPARATVEMAHARPATDRRWVNTEKDILETAELRHLDQLLLATSTDPVTLMKRVMQMRAFLETL